MPAERQSPAGRGVAGWIFCAVFAIGFGFALYTHHAWEDYYITYRCSKNLATGQGLVFTPGERVHAFTSPLNTLIPAALSFATGNTSDRLVLWLFRAVSCAALAGAAVLLYRIARSQSLGRLATFTWIGLFATLPGIVDYSINGQETGLMMFFLALALYSLMVPARRNWLCMGIAWGGLMWTRPDACVYIAAIAGTFLFFNAGAPAHRTRLELFKTFVIAGVLAAVLYLPWVVWAWWYFGSPIPHTVIAKGLEHSLRFPDLWAKTLALLEEVVSGSCVWLALVFAPPNAFFPEWPKWIFTGCTLLGWTAALYWILPFGQRQTRALSLAFLVGIWYVSVVAPCPFAWYWPNAALLGVCVLGQIVDQAARLLRQLEGLQPAKAWLVRTRDWALWRARLLHGAVAVSIPLFSVTMLLMCGVQMRIQQREIERGNRMQIGLWLRANAKSPQDSVFLEPLGYIGFYSQLKMFDWPGLCSGEVVAARKKCPAGSWAGVIAELRPDWLVLRPREIPLIRSQAPRLLSEDYAAVKVFDVSERLQAYPWIPGRYYPMFDQTFTVFRRLPAKSREPRVACRGDVH